MVKQRNVYISGPITNTPGYEANFERAENFIRAGGDNPFNPISVVHADSWEQCMREDIILLLACDAIYLLHGWEHSKGAMLEFEIAVALGMSIYYER